MNDISKDKDYQEFFVGIKELAKGLMQIRERAAIEYAPIVEEFCARKHATANEVGRMLDYLFTRVRDNILKSKEQKTIQPTKGGHKMVACQNYVSLFYCQITSCPSDGRIS